MKKLLCKLLGHRFEWAKRYELAFYDPEPIHTITCTRCKTSISR